MAGTIEGGRKSAATNMAKYGPDFYRNIGRRGGTNGHDGGFASKDLGKDGLTGPERAKIAGAKGGARSRRGKAKSALAKELSDALRELREATANGKEREEANA